MFNKIGDEISRNLSLAFEKAAEVFDGLKFVVGETTAATRKVQTHERYEKHKLTMRLAQGGYGKLYAKAFSAALKGDDPKQKDIISVNPAELDYNSITMWFGDDNGKPEVITKLEEWIASNSSPLQDKRDSLAAILKKNPTWMGAMTRVDTKGDAREWLGNDSGDNSEQGRHPWMCCNKTASWRWGPNAWPLVGMGSLVYISAPGIVLQLFKAEAFVDQGVVSLSDLPSYLETPTGLKTLKEDDTWCLLDFSDKVGVAWVPFGYLVTMLVMPGDDRKSENELGFAWCATSFSAERGKHMSEKTWAAVSTLNKAHFERMSKQPLWATRSSVFYAFMEALRA